MSPDSLEMWSVLRHPQNLFYILFPPDWPLISQDAPEGTYDAIIVDSSDPVGPAEVLFQKARVVEYSVQGEQRF